MSEHAEQVALIKWARLMSGSMPELSLLFAVPNGGARSKAAAGKLKAEGVLAGVPDLVLPVPRGPFGACYIELKVPAHNGKPAGRESPAQREMRKALTDAGNCVEVCWGWTQACEALETYLAFGLPRAAP